jgi:hypothetical protein
MPNFTLDHLTKYLTEDESVEDQKATNDVEAGFTMEPKEDGSYTIFKGSKKIVDVSYTNKKNDESEDFEVAQENPDNYDVYLSNVADVIYSKEFEKKLEALGFDNIISTDDQVISDEPVEKVDEE